MKNAITLSLLAVGLTLAGSAQSATPYSFQTAAGSSFTSYFSVTPTASNKLLLSVSGTDLQYSALSFKFLNGELSGTTFNASQSNGNLVAAFNDYLDTFVALTSGTAYTIEIKGVTRDIVPGSVGIVSINALKGTIAAIPEPESYAMLLAGLGLIGTIARRRRQAPTR